MYYISMLLVANFSQLLILIFSSYWQCLLLQIKANELAYSLFRKSINSHCLLIKRVLKGNHSEMVKEIFLMRTAHTGKQQTYIHVAFEIF